MPGIAMQNVEYKAELRDIEPARRQCVALKAQHIGVLQQTDTYYRLPDGRLKQRTAPGEPVEWIFYHRADRINPRLCNYTILNEDQARRRWGTGQLQPWLTVRKTRELWMHGSVRIHLDEVERLGRFLELEAVVSRGFDVNQCNEALRSLRRTFSPWLGEPISVSYSDLIARLDDPLDPDDADVWDRI